MEAYNLSIGTVLSFIVAISLVIIAMTVIKNYFPLIIKHKAFDLKQYKKWLYIFEIVIFIVLAIIFGSIIAQRNIILAFSIVLGLMLILWYLSQFFLKDYIAGLVIKSKNNLHHGDDIEVDQTQGTIIALGSTQLKIKDQKSNLQIIPYSLMFGKIKSMKSKREQINAIRFTFEIEDKPFYEHELTALSNHINLLPWVQNKIPCTVKFNSNEDKRQIIEIKLFAISEDYSESIKSAIKVWISNKKTVN
ncbi:MAG: mechanosensitive ion channel [Bacteroidales bacterium]|nr:mechanosensitive ion channel [Bacteroidales bacterium]